MRTFFLGKVEQLFDETLANGSVEDVSFVPMLESTAGMNVQQANGDPWLQRVTVFQERSIPFPPWIVTRHDELSKRTRLAGERLQDLNTSLKGEPIVDVKLPYYVEIVSAIHAARDLRFR